MIISAVLSGPTGNIQLQQNGIYKLEASTRDQAGVTQRKTDATNPFVEGTFTVAAVRENVTENISIYVYAPSMSVRRARIDAITEALDQTHYTLAFTTEELTETWTCMAADYSIARRHELNMHYMALIKANIPRLPKVVYS